MLHLPIVLLLLLPTAVQATQRLGYNVPDGWKPRAPASAMRVAEFVLPHAEGDAEDGDVIIFFFGGQGGDVEANVTRWISQMQQPDGRASKDVATRASKTINGMPVTIVDVSGTYIAEVRPGSAEHFNKPHFRMRAAVVQTAGGPYFVKMLGPDATIVRWNASFDQFLGTFQYR